MTDDPYPQNPEDDIEQWVKERAETWGADLNRYRALAGVLDTTVEIVCLIQVSAWLHTITGELHALRKPVFHENCEGCKNERRFHELQWEMMNLSVRHLRHELGEEENWKGES